MKKGLIRIGILLGLAALAAFAVIFWWLPMQQRAANGQAARQEQDLVRYQTAAVREADLTATIGATGAVRSRQSAVLVWQTSGTVSSVGAAAGEVVAAGTELARLEQTSLPQMVILAQAELVNAQKNLDTLLESTQARANAQLAVVKAEKALEDALDDRASKLYQRASPETIDIARARLITANEALDQAESFFDGHSSNPESLTYAAALDQLAKARQLQTQAQYNLNYVQGLPSPLDIEEVEAQIAVAEANLLQAKLDWERVMDGPNDQDVAAAEARVTAAQATLNLVRISAPFDGTLTQANSKVGDQVAPGTVAFQLDDLSHLYVDVSVAEVEIARVQVGQSAVIAFDALPEKQYPGTVTEIGAIGKNTAGTVNFIVTIEINTPGAEIKPGMTASAAIVVGRSQGALLVPTRAVRLQDGQRVVYLLKENAPVPVAVITGTVTGPDTTITGGALQAGDLVILNPTILP